MFILGIKVSLKLENQLISAVHHIGKSKVEEHVDSLRKCIWQKLTRIYEFKILSKVGIEGNFLNLIKDIYQNNVLLFYLMVNDWIPFH